VISSLRKLFVNDSHDLVFRKIDRASLDALRGFFEDAELHRLVNEAGYSLGVGFSSLFHEIYKFCVCLRGKFYGALRESCHRSPLRAGYMMKTG